MLVNNYYDSDFLKGCKHFFDSVAPKKQALCHHNLKSCMFPQEIVIRPQRVGLGVFQHENLKSFFNCLQLNEADVLSVILFTLTGLYPVNKNSTNYRYNLHRERANT